MQMAKAENTIQTLRVTSQKNRQSLRNCSHFTLTAFKFTWSDVNIQKHVA